MDPAQSFGRQNVLLSGHDKLQAALDALSRKSTPPSLFSPNDDPSSSSPSSSYPLAVPPALIHYPGLPSGPSDAGMGRSTGSGGGRGAPNEATLALVLPLLILLSTLLFLLLMFLLFLIIVRRRRGITLRDEDGPLDVGREEEYEASGGMEGTENAWLEAVEVGTRKGYARAKDWQMSNRVNSHPSDITLSQFLTIQEKGVSAWSFEPDYELNPPVFVQSRTEITFLADGAGMAPEEGGGCCVHSNLPLPRLNEVYYWEVKLFEKPEETTVAIGLTTKPYPSFRLPGWNKFSIGYFSSDGNKCHNQPFSAVPYGPPLLQGDVLGVGYRPRSGTAFFTRNGRKLEDAYVGLDRYNLFPTVGANGAATLHVNLGQAGFVFIEANVKKWGLAPTMGTLAPPPAYGAENDSIRLQAAADVGARMASSMAGASEAGDSRRHRRKRAKVGADGNPVRSTHTAVASTSRGPPPPTSQPVATTSSSPQPMPTPPRSGRQSQLPRPARGGARRAPTEDDDDDESLPHNPPTPNILDISLHSLRPYGDHLDLDREEEGSSSGVRRRGSESEGSSEGSGGMSPTMDLSRERDRRRLLSESEDLERTGFGIGVGMTHGASGAMTSPPQNTALQPPGYSDVDPNKYPAGVWEAMLEEQFQTAASASASQASHHPHSSHYHHQAHPAAFNQGGGYPGHGSTSHLIAPHLQAGPSGTSPSAGSSLRSSYEGRNFGTNASGRRTSTQRERDIESGSTSSAGASGTGTGRTSWRNWFNARAATDAGGQDAAQ